MEVIKEMRNAATDLTEGTPWKIIMRFSIPLFFTFLLQQFYNMVDTIVVGQFLGKDALAGDQFYDHRILYGTCQWFCHSGRTALRGKRL